MEMKWSCEWVYLITRQTRLIMRQGRAMEGIFSPVALKSLRNLLRTLFASKRKNALNILHSGWLENQRWKLIGPKRLPKTHPIEQNGEPKNVMS